MTANFICNICEDPIEDWEAAVSCDANKFGCRVEKGCRPGWRAHVCEGCLEGVYTFRRAMEEDAKVDGGQADANRRNAVPVPEAEKTKDPLVRIHELFEALKMPLLELLGFLSARGVKRVSDLPDEAASELVGVLESRLADEATNEKEIDDE